MSEGERRLAAIMFADIVGYSLISARNERKALEQVAELRSLFQGVLPRFDGRVVKTMGDGFLVEFASAVKAVDCATEAQRELARVNVDRAAEDVLRVRIGIHVGDVIHSEGDVLGDAVNIASRVQALADPGGILVTRQVFDQVKGKVESGMSTVGLRELKNIPGQVELFRVLQQPASLESAGRHELDPHRLAILPFANLSPDPNDGYFADGLTEELISTISRIGELSVISRASAMRYKDTRLAMDQIGQELRVGTILEGSVRKAGNRVRIAAQLLNVKTDRYVWSQNYDRDLTDIFEVQGEIAERVAEGLKVELLLKEKQRLEKKLTTSTDAYTFYLQGRAHWGERSKEGSEKAVRCFKEAIGQDPVFAEAYSGLADAYAVLADYGWMDSTKAGDLAREYAKKALALDESLAEAHASLGIICVNHLWNFEAGEKEFKRAIELNSNYAPAYHWYGLMLWYRRRYEESFQMMQRASELDPRSRVIKQTAAVALIGLGKVSEGLQLLEKLVPEYPKSVAVHYWMTIAHISLGEFREAIEEAEREVELDGWSNDSKLDLAYAKAVAGEKGEAAKLLKEATSKAGEYISPVSIALVELGMGNDEEGLEWLRKACEQHDPEFLYFRSIPLFAKYWSDPRTLEMERNAGLVS